MATFVRRDQGRWQAKIRRDGYPRISKTFQSCREAEIWARQTEGDMDHGTFVDRSAADAITYANVLKRYTAEIVPRKRGAADEVSKTKPYLSNALVHKPLSSIKPQDIAELRDWRLQAVTPGTVLREFAVLRHAFEIAAKEWFLPQNPVKQVRAAVSKSAEGPGRNYFRLWRIADDPKFIDSASWGMAFQAVR